MLNMLDLDQLKSKYQTHIRKYGVLIMAAVSILSIIFLGFPGKSSSYAIIFRLYVVLFLLMGLGFYVVRILKGKLPGVASNQMKIVERLVLEPGVSIYIVEKNAEEILIGVGNKQIIELKNGINCIPKDFQTYLYEEQTTQS